MYDRHRYHTFASKGNGYNKRNYHNVPPFRNACVNNRHSHYVNVHKNRGHAYNQFNAYRRPFQRSYNANYVHKYDYDRFIHRSIIKCHFCGKTVTSLQGAS